MHPFVLYDIIYLVYFLCFHFIKGVVHNCFLKVKIPHSDYIPIIIIGLLLYKLINNPSIFLSEIQGILKYIISFYLYNLGICNCILLNPLMVLLEKKLKIRRILSISIIYVVFIAVLGILITVITPAISTSIKQLANDVPDYIETTETKISETIEN